MASAGVPRPPRKEFSVKKIFAFLAKPLSGCLHFSGQSTLREHPKPESHKAMTQLFEALNPSDEEQLTGGCKTSEIEKLFKAHEANVKKGHSDLEEQIFSKLNALDQKVSRLRK